MANISDAMGLTTEMMFGKNALHVPFHGVVQDMSVAGNGVVLCVFASKLPPKNPLMMGANESHVLLQGDMIIRPRNAFASNHCRGYGIAGLATSSSFSSTDEWVEKGRILLLNHERKILTRDNDCGTMFLTIEKRLKRKGVNDEKVKWL